MDSCYNWSVRKTGYIVKRLKDDRDDIEYQEIRYVDVSDANVRTYGWYISRMDSRDRFLRFDPILGTESPKSIKSHENGVFGDI